ncbi:MAG: nucleoside hydrolase [Planctomycetes bacterium]|nr:nucleoside hydrolase [Planctomycetota bacterium]
MDDALALGLACQSPELRLLGVTTVYRDPVQRAGQALAVLQAFGCAGGCGNRQAAFAPVGPPASVVLADDYRPPRSGYGPASRGTVPTGNSVRGGTADHSLLHWATNEPGCGVGSGAGIGREAAHRTDGGMISGQRCETNMAADPEAARIVFASGADITMVGLDVTLRCQLSPDQVDQIRRCEHASTRLLVRMIDAWKSHSRRPPTLHDPLAVAMCFDPSLCT